MRVVILATVLLATSSLYPSLAQEAAEQPTLTLLWGYGSGS